MGTTKMTRTLAAVAFTLTLLAGVAALAGPQTVTLAIDGMTCASCPYIVRTALLEVPGVERAEVSLADRRAVVTFDDVETDIAALTRATEALGFPARVVSE